MIRAKCIQWWASDSPRIRGGIVRVLWSDWTTDLIPGYTLAEAREFGAVHGVPVDNASQRSSGPARRGRPRGGTRE